ncbi:MAG: DEAD/DEAH box helicase, partial [Terriglobus roseus]|nr:DEAD/DEAH box helicase [Terriglobus roseus]
MPIFQRIIAEDPSLAQRSFGRTSASDIRAIIISPTRELAEQIAVEARRVSKYTGVIVQAAVGGTQKGKMLYETRRQGCHILVATPGRLSDLLSDPSSGIDAPRLSMFVLDEADRLLDQGFWDEVQSIRRMLPEPRENKVQTLMFSATVPQQVVSAVRETLQPGFRFIKCVREDDEPTHARVPQNLVRLASMQNALPAVYELCLNEIEARAREASASPFKAIIYFNSTAMVEVAGQVFNNLTRSQGPLRGLPVFRVHSKLTQMQRTRESDGFRRSRTGILISSDVTARGLDFPNVTHVMQVGVPQTGEQYVHRVGRTGRAGKEGAGYLFIHPLEEQVARSRLRELPLKPNTSLESAKVDLTAPTKTSEKVAAVVSGLTAAHRRVDGTTFADAYRSLLGTHQFVDNKQQLIDSMNDLTRYGWGLEQPPALSRALIQKLGLSRVAGLNAGDYGSRSSYPGRNDGGFNDGFNDAFSQQSGGRGDG